MQAFLIYNDRGRLRNSYRIASSLLGATVGILISYYGIIVPSIPISAILVVIALSVAFLFINDLIKKVSFRRFGITDSGMQH